MVGDWGSPKFGLAGMTTCETKRKKKIEKKKIRKTEKKKKKTRENETNTSNFFLFIHLLFFLNRYYISNVMRQISGFGQ